MIKKKFDIPKLDEKKWQDLQDTIDSFMKLFKEIEEKKSEMNKYIDTRLDMMYNYLRQLDIILGRTYTADEVVEYVRNKFLNKEKKDGNISQK